ncbi:SH3 domain-containing protein [Desulforhopalus vacuolatus]|uniref:SH3 domain-containing protein n=1 Tax=Desulforhopalus vacuolatus TaxID=40414 RepID=UPI001F067971|nr:SH3 domain-containing protein [Desulforhopalus vacuolatus]
MASVKGDNVNMRKGPGTNNSIVWAYDRGFPLKVITEKKQWVEVIDFEGDSGWIYRSLLSNAPHVIVKVNKGSRNKVNIRSQPGKKGKIIGQASYGVVFSRLEEKNGWLKVEHESGLKGWLKKSLVWGGE